MARQFTTFSVVDILGQGSSEEQASSAPVSRTASDGDSNSESSSSSGVTVKYRHGTIRQMLPPAPAVSYSPNADQEHPFLYTQSTDDLTSCEGEKETSTTEKRPPSKRGRKRKRGTKRGRVSSEVEDVYQPVEEAEDDVFRSNPSRRTTRAASGESPSPPGDKPTGTTATNSLPAEPSKTSSASSDQREEPEEEEEEEQPKKKRTRTAYTREQLQTMERHFRKSAYPDSKLLKIISSEARIPVPKIQVWFQNRRAKARKWGQVLPEPSSNSALYRGVLPSADSSRYLPPLQPSSSSPCSKTTPTQDTPPTTSSNSHPLSASSSLLPPFLTPYQRFYQPPPYALLPPSLPYPLCSYSLYTGVQSNRSLKHFQNSASQPVITVDSNKQHF